MLQQRPLMYYIIVTHDNLNFALRGDRTALCSYENLLSFLAALSILLILVRRDFFRNDHRHNVRLPLLFGVQFLILWIFHHRYRVVLLPNIVIVVCCGSILADICFFQIAFVGLESFTRVSLILTSQLERVLTWMQDRDRWTCLLHLAELLIRLGSTFKVVYCLWFGCSRRWPWHVTDVTETRYSTRIVAFLIAARVLARVIETCLVLRCWLGEQLIRVSGRVSSQLRTAYFGLMASCCRLLSLRPLRWVEHRLLFLLLRRHGSRCATAQIILGVIGHLGSNCVTLLRCREVVLALPYACCQLA